MANRKQKSLISSLKENLLERTLTAALLTGGILIANTNYNVYNQLNALEEDFEAASFLHKDEVVKDILKERDKLLRNNLCTPACWTKNYDNTFYFSDPICFKPY